LGLEISNNLWKRKKVSYALWARQERAHIEPGQFKEIDKYNKIYASFEYSIIYRLYQTYKNVK